MLRYPTLFIAITAAACGGPLDESFDEESSEIWRGDTPYIDYDNCSAQREATIGRSLIALRANIHPRFGGARYLECLEDAVYSEVWGRSATPEEIYARSNARGELEIACQDLDDGVWGLASSCDGTQQIEVDESVVDLVTRGRVSEGELGALVLHELLHVEDGGCFSHPEQTGTLDYELSVNRQAQRCASPARPTVARSNLTGKVPQAWMAWSAPPALPSGFRRVSLECPDDRVMVGLVTGTSANGVSRLALRCARPTASGYDASSLVTIGTIGPTGVSLVTDCPRERALVSFSARFDRGTSTRLRQVGGSCWPVTNLRGGGASFVPLSTLSIGSGGSTEATRACPTGRALVGLVGIERGTARTLEALQPICRPIGEVGRRDLVTYTTGSAAGGTGGSPAYLRCLGNGIGSGLTGGAGARVDRLALICDETDAAGGALRGALSVSPSVGGAGGVSFSTRCGAGQALVGLTGRAGARVDRVAPICADFAGWRAGTTSTVIGAASGGGGGSAFTRTCARGRFVVGLRTRSGAELDSVRLVCSDGRRP